MSSAQRTYSAIDAPTQFLKTGSRTLAYRAIGGGSPLILCVRFRGILDSWDPAFIDALAKQFRVVIFDYSGLGRSTGTASYDHKSLALDAIDLANGLGIDRFAIGGWSLGGIAAQVLTVSHPDRVTHTILIGTTPPGQVPFGPEPVFFERALKPVNDLDDETVLFFEPISKASCAAAKASHDRIAARTIDISPPVPEETYVRLLKESRHEDLFHDDGGYRDFLAKTSIPVLVISGDHEIVFPVGNWFDAVRHWESLQLVVLPRAGHGVHHQYPDICADMIISFVKNRR